MRVSTIATGLGVLAASAWGAVSPVTAATVHPRPPSLATHVAKPVDSDSPASLSYQYADGQQLATGIGLSAQLRQADPKIGPGDYHSLAEITAESADGKQIVEVGWNVDPGLNHDSLPHLFVYHWINGLPTCYNNLCPGYVQVSSTIVPGQRVTASPTSLFGYAIKHRTGSGWWLGYTGKWFGYFPDSDWTSQGVTFTQEGLVQWFGEVALNGNNHTQMGNGVFGSKPGSAVITKMAIITTTGTVPASASPYVSAPTCYDVGSFTGHSFQFGGPGC